jgi:hypothetical protein
VNADQHGETHQPEAQSDTVIPSTSDDVAFRANMAAIDRLVTTRKYHHIVAWGKWLGFTPETVEDQVELAEAEHAPEDSIQKLYGTWIRVGDIVNEANRQQVNELAGQPCTR